LLARSTVSWDRSQLGRTSNDASAAGARAAAIGLPVSSSGACKGALRSLCRVPGHGY
jgi:hypothetical protein